MPGEDNSNLNLDSYDTSVLFKREIVNTLDSSTSTSDEDLDKFLFFKTVTTSTTTTDSNPFLFKTVQTKLKVSSSDDIINNSNAKPPPTPRTTTTIKSAKQKKITNSTSIKLVSNDSEYGDFQIHCALKSEKKYNIGKSNSNLLRKS